MAGEKFLKHDGLGGQEEVEATQVGGAGAEDSIPALDAAGRLDVSMMPTGIGADTVTLEASGTIAAGDFVNIFDDGGTPKCRKADASSRATIAHGFCKDAIAAAATGLVYLEGNNEAVTGQVAGEVYLSTTAGEATGTPPSAAGEVVQRLGIATGASSINFEPQNPVTLA